MTLLLKIVSTSLEIVGGGWTLFGAGTIVLGYVSSHGDYSTLMDPFSVLFGIGGLFFFLPGVAIVGIGLLVGRMADARRRRA